MLSQIVSLLVSHFFGRQNLDASGFIANMTLASMRRFMLIVAGILSSLAVFTGGAFTVLMDLVLSSRDHGQLMLSSPSVVGFLLMGVSILALFLLFNRSFWRRSREVSTSREEAITKAITPVVDAVAGLIRDFAEERKQAMAAAMAMPASAMAASETQNPGSDLKQPPLFN